MGLPPVSPHVLGDLPLPHVSRDKLSTPGRESSAASPLDGDSGDRGRAACEMRLGLSEESEALLPCLPLPAAQLLGSRRTWRRDEAEAGRPGGVTPRKSSPAQDGLGKCPGREHPGSGLPEPLGGAASKAENATFQNQSSQCDSSNFSSP